MFLKNRNIISKIRRSKVTDYAALSDLITQVGRIRAHLFLGVKAIESEDLYSAIDCTILVSKVMAMCTCVCPIKWHSLLF